MDSLTLALGAAAVLGAGLSLGLFLLISTLRAAKAASDQKIVEIEAQLDEARSARETADHARITAEAEARRLTELENALKAEREARAAADRQASDLKARLEAEQAHHADKLAELDKARERLTEQFKLTANEILKASGEDLAKKGQESLTSLLNPLREQLKGFQDKVQEDAVQRASHSTSLAEMVKLVREDARSMTEDARNLANALRSSSKMQGDWGELVLSSILERAGLREGEEFFTQETKTAEDGSKLRSDVVVAMPDGHSIVIDSKVSLTAFERAVNAEDEETRDLELKAHLASMRSHIKTLGQKDYAALYDGVSFTFMFVPLEGAATIALQTDPELTLLAAEHDVMIATPTTLMMAMRTVQNLWMVDRQNRNAIEIADSAGRLYDKFVGFVETFDKVGRGLGTAQRAFDEAKGQLAEGRGNLVKRADDMRRLGAKARKSMPAEYSIALEEETEDLALPEPEAADS